MSYRGKVTLAPGDWLGTTSEGLFRVNKTQFFNPKYYRLIGSNDTQLALISRLQSGPSKPTTKPKAKPKAKPKVPVSDLDRELNQLVNIKLLKGHLITHFNRVDKLRALKRCGANDEAIVKTRHISKGQGTIRRYVTKLKEDPSFQIVKPNKADKSVFQLVYKGQYASTTMTVAF
jgi:hypothetical protein